MVLLVVQLPLSKFCSCVLLSGYRHNISEAWAFYYDSYSTNVTLSSFRLVMVVVAIAAALGRRSRRTAPHCSFYILAPLLLKSKSRFTDSFKEPFKMPNTYNIVVFGGDHCGPEVTAEALKVCIALILQCSSNQNLPNHII